jgi:hypothetical protein
MGRHGADAGGNANLTLTAELSLLKNAFGVGIGLQMIAAEFMSGPYIADVCDRGE